MSYEDYQASRHLVAEGHNFTALMMAAMQLARQDPEAVYLKRFQFVFPELWDEFARYLNSPDQEQARARR